MDILDFFWTFYLNHLSPLWGYFSKLESWSVQMYLICFVIVIMAGFGFDDDDFSLSGLMQEGHDFDVTVISSSSDNDNYDGLLDCA